MTLLLAALAAAAAAREPRSAVLPVSNLRGGQLAQLASAEPPAAPLTASSPPELSSGAALQGYLEAMGGFMERFSQLVDTATGSCKPNFFGMPSPSAAKIRSRPDRQALQQAHRHLQLLLLLDDTEPPLGSPSA